MTEFKGKTENNIIKGCRLLKNAVFAFILIIFVLSLVVYAYASVNLYFAEVYSNTVSRYLRTILASITAFLPFSLAETVVLAGVPAFIVLLARALVMGLYYGDKKRIIRFLKGLVCVILALVSLFINTFGICYKRYPVSQMMKLETEELTNKELFAGAYIASSFASGLCGDFTRLPNGSTASPYGFDEMVQKIHDTYKILIPGTPDILSVKPVAVSGLWTYTHISGMYFPFTGESNINMNYPDFLLAFSVGHEIAHQLGIANEQDANMLAFLALVYSDDDYLVYSAYMNALEYIIADLDMAEAALLLSNTDRRILSEFAALYKHMDAYSNETIAGISTEINDAYLKANGVEEGTKSYSKVTYLICNFLKAVYPEYFS